MKYKFGKTSKQQIKTLHSDLIVLFTYALATTDIDFTIKEGHRCKDLQNKYYREGKSKLKFPKSKHNFSPSLAVDIYPIPTTKENFIKLSNHIKKCSKFLSIHVVWGGDWLTIVDMPHWELV